MFSSSSSASSTVFGRPFFPVSFLLSSAAPGNSCCSGLFFWGSSYKPSWAWPRAGNRNGGSFSYYGQPANTFHTVDLAWESEFFSVVLWTRLELTTTPWETTPELQSLFPYNPNNFPLHCTSKEWACRLHWFEGRSCRSAPLLSSPSCRWRWRFLVNPRRGIHRAGSSHRANDWCT